MLLFAVLVSLQTNLDLVVKDIQGMSSADTREVLLQEPARFIADQSEPRIQKDSTWRYVPKPKKTLTTLERLVAIGPSGFPEISVLILVRKPLRANLFQDYLEVAIKKEPDTYSVVPLIANPLVLGKVQPLEVRDIAYFALGQVVNRRFGQLSDSQGVDFPSLQPKSIPISMAWLAKSEIAVKRSLIVDVLRPDCEWRDIEGIRRLWRYFPKETIPVILQKMSMPIRRGLHTSIRYMDTHDVRGTYTSYEALTSLEFCRFMESVSDISSDRIDAKCAELLLTLSKPSDLSAYDDVAAGAIVSRLWARSKYRSICLAYLMKRRGQEGSCTATIRYYLATMKDQSVEALARLPQ